MVREVIAEHRAEGEPRTMARVEGMCAERWPHRIATIWIEKDEPRRHVAIRFTRDIIEGAGRTWFEAFENVDNERRNQRVGK